MSFFDETQAESLNHFLVLGMYTHMHKKSHRLIITRDISLIKSIKVHLSKSKIFILYFYDSICEKKFWRKYSLFKQNKCFYRILSFNEKGIDIAEN